MQPRRLLLAAPALLAACSILPDRPFVPARRYLLEPRRASRLSPPPGAPVLLVRRLRAVPGLQDVALRRQRADGAYEVAAFEEWIAPPADLAEAALRGWLGASGLFAAVVAPGSRADSPLVLEAQLTTLETTPAEARAALAGVLLREERLSSRVLRAFEVAGSVPLAANADSPAQAAGMAAALGRCFDELESVLAPHLR
jgi:ABC-type uncharacterized transport system auxiliary subunit